MFETKSKAINFDHLFRHEYSRLVALLTNKYGASHIDLVEDAVQEALYKAMRLWPYKEVPDNPSAWLYRVAHSYMIDAFRKNRFVSAAFNEDRQATETDDLNQFHVAGELEDEQLKMIFACCHPEMNENEQIMLSLKLLGGFSVAEVASAFMKKQEAVKKSIFRARKKFQERVGDLEVPAGAALVKRMQGVVKVIYLMFNEGYKATEGNDLIRRDVCEEAIRLAVLLTKNEFCNTVEVNALLGLMCFNASRFNARIMADGSLVLFKDQDRSKWDQQYIEAGRYFLTKASKGDVISTYHIQAAIASCYSLSVSYDKIDWKTILHYYNLLQQIDSSPLVSLNRIVVLSKYKTAAIALEALEILEKEIDASRYYLFDLIKSDLLFENMQNEAALRHLAKAISKCTNAPEKVFLQKKLNYLNSI